MEFVPNAPWGREGQNRHPTAFHLGPSLCMGAPFGVGEKEAKGNSHVLFFGGEFPYVDTPHVPHQRGDIRMLQSTFCGILRFAADGWKGRRTHGAPLHSCSSPEVSGS